MLKSVVIIFEAEVTEVYKRYFRFRRTDLGWGVVKKLMFENFGKLIHEEADFTKAFSIFQKVRFTVTYLNTLQDAEYSQSAGRAIMRGIVNEKFAYGMSIRKPVKDKIPFFEKVFANFETGHLVESNSFEESRNPFESGDAVEIIIMAV